MEHTEKKEILLALSTSRHSKEAIRQALDFSKSEKTGLMLLYVIEEEIPNKIADYVGEMGFMGDKTSEVFKKSLIEEYKERAEEEMKNLETLCEREGIPLSKQVCEGNFSQEVLKMAEKARPRMIFLNKREDRSELGRWIFGSEVEKIKSKSPCPVRVIK